MGLELTLQQTQRLSQNMIQSVQILQMTTQELQDYVQEAALENPTMDVELPHGESIDGRSAVLREEEQTHYLSQRQNNDDDFDPKNSWNFQAEETQTIRDALWLQVDHHRFSGKELSMLDFLLENIDERGYLSLSLEEAAKLLHVETSLLEPMLAYLQTLEPLGICARNLRECLLIQLKAEGEVPPALLSVLDEGLEAVARNKVAALSRRFGITVSEAESYCRRIRACNPKPGSLLSASGKIPYIIPDVYVTVQDGQPVVALNESFSPQITVNQYYQSLLLNASDSEVRDYLSRKVRQTEWVRHCIEQREKTLLAVSREIVERQKAFFLSGQSQLVPMRMAEVAETIRVHESTVSRAINNKYLSCSRGVFPMSHFFQKNAVPKRTANTFIVEEAETSTGYTNRQVKDALREIIAAEEPKKPFSDRILSEKLTERGFSISRRTVAKYREEEGIPDASGRKIRTK